MKDLTQGTIWRHLVGMAVFIGAGLLVQTLYLLIDLYFVSRLGKEAVAGVASAGTSTFITMALVQFVAVGSLSLISHAIGRKDPADAQAVFEQALSLGLLMALLYFVIGYTVGPLALNAIAADPETAAYARAYLFTFLPALASMFPSAALGSALRASGVVRQPMLLQSATVVLNAILAPVLIMGLGTGHPLGVAGAGLASTIASVFGSFGLVFIFGRVQSHMHLTRRSLRPDPAIWKRIAKVGIPATGEFALIFIVSAVIYWCIRGFGPQAQAGFGIGSRVMQSIFLPSMAVAFATGPIAGQNFGARHRARVHDTFRHAAIMGALIMLALTLLCQIAPQVLVTPFSSDPSVVAIAAGYLKVASWNFVAIGLTFTCSGMFQALGDTRPSLISSGSRLVTYVLPAIWLAGQAGTSLQDFWWLGVASTTLQAVFSFLLLRHQLHHKMKLFEPHTPAAPAVTSA